MSAAADPQAQSVVVRTNMLLPGLLAWVATLASPSWERGVGALPRTTAVLALAAMVAGPLLTGRHPRLGRVLGIHATMALSVVTWLLLGSVVTVLHLEPVRSAIGAVAWVLFAFGWGAVRTREHVPEDDPRVLPGAPLPSRDVLPMSAVVVLSIGVLGAAVPMFAAWRVTRPSHALLAHAVATICAIALVTSAARVAVDRKSYRPLTPPSARFSAAARPLSALAVAVALGFIWMLLR
jgi:hypothetical protein